MTEKIKILYKDEIPGASHWSMLVRRGLVLRLIDLQGGANVGMLFYNPINLLERYNAPDTLKCQHTFKLTAGHCLYSDMGRIFCSIVEDQVGWHDSICGTSQRADIADRWGEISYQEGRNDWTQNGMDSFLVEAGKYGLTGRDIPANVNWFSKVSPNSEGELVFEEGHSKPDNSVALRFEMDTLVLFHTCAHPFDTATEFPRRPIAYEFYEAEDVSENDLCRMSCPENQRGFQNTELYNLMAPAPSVSGVSAPNQEHKQ